MPAGASPKDERRLIRGNLEQLDELDVEGASSEIDCVAKQLVEPCARQCPLPKPGHGSLLARPDLDLLLRIRPVADVAHDRRDADHLAALIADRREADRE